MAGKLKVDSDGFRKRVAWRGPFGVLSELVSNALDERIAKCDVKFVRAEGGRYSLTVEDDSPEGFRNLEESYTLYADSYKVSNAGQRGRFNFGEKVAIILCDEARIESTTGTVIFDRSGDVRRSSKRRDRGTVFTGTMRCTRDQADDALARLRTIIPPDGITLTVNGLPVERPKLVATVEATLPTIGEGEDGALVRTERKTTVDVYEPADPSTSSGRGGQGGMIYELGIPVVKVDHPYLIDVRQKVPMSVDRNTVTPGYYRRLCGAVLDGVFDKLSPDQSRSKGITEGLAAARNDEAVRIVMDRQHGPTRFVPDPKNREATGELTARGYRAVAPNAYDRETWERIRQAGAVPSGSELMPKRTVPGVPLPAEEETEGMRQFRDFARFVCRKALGKELTVRYSLTVCSAAAQCGPCGDGVAATFHVAQLGRDWFSERPATCRENLDLLFHELGHHTGAEDCTRAFADQVTFVASTVAILMLTEPAAFEEWR